jgi:hypothetical protein
MENGLFAPVDDTNNVTRVPATRVPVDVNNEFVFTYGGGDTYGGGVLY